MDLVAAWSEKERAELFREAGALKQLAPAVVEKDFWVCWTLGKLFGSAELGPSILFKGGTSLSKVFGLIDRFSEDVDLILDWGRLTRKNPLHPRSATRQLAFNKNLLQLAHAYLRDSFLPELRGLVADVCRADIGENPEVVNVIYPAAFPSDYLRPQIQLEVGPLAAWAPHAEYAIHPYAAEVLPEFFSTPNCRVLAITAERTFWEKITILHHEAHRPEDRAVPFGYSRHYYDVFRMAQTPVKNMAIADLDLLRSVVSFKERFYRRAWARYDLAVPGSLKLIPPDHVRLAMERDYEQMAFMIFGERPAFPAILETIQALEAEINAH